MKLITNVCRVLVGLLFIFSGFIKLNDPYGLSYKLDEYFGIFAGDLETRQDSIKIIFTGPATGEDPDGKDTANIQLFRGVETYDLKLVSRKGTVQYTRDSAGAILDSGVLINTELQVDGQSVIVQVHQHTFDSTWDHAVQVHLSAGVEGQSIMDKGYDISKEVLSAEEGTSEWTESLNVTEYIKADSFLVHFFLWLKNHVIFLAIFLCVVEIILGIALLIGWQSQFTSIMLLITILFFTFLTWYSSTYDKVTDCGCFGDCLPLDPKQSFFKDVILLVLILIITFQAKKIKPLFSNPFSVKVLTLLTVATAGYGFYCYTYLPIIDCLYWEKGANFCELMAVPEGERADDHKIMVYTYKNADGEEYVFEFDTETNETSKPWPDMTVFKHASTVEKVIEEAYEPPIHDFTLMSPDGSMDYKEDFLSMEKKLLAVFVDLNLADMDAVKELNEIARQWKEDGYEFFALTASSPDEAESFRHENQLNFEFYFGDNTNLKSIIRSNPGLLLITDTCTIKDKWPSRRLPKYKKIRKLAE